MIDQYVKRPDVKKLIDNITKIDKYYQKNNDFSHAFLGIDKKNKALFVLYEALLKYKIIVGDIYHLDSFIEQLDLLYRKLTDFNDIVIGINKIITRLCIKKLNIGHTNTYLNRKLLLDYIYNAYIVNGYYVHGFSSCYSESISVLGFEAEDYENYYDDFRKINQIFNKYNIINVCEKDFDRKEVFFTDNFLYGCACSLRGPMYLYNVLSNSDIDNKIDPYAYVRDDYKTCLKNLKRLFLIYNFSEADKKFVLDTVEKEWNLLHRREKKISLLLVKRRLFNEENNIDINGLANNLDLSIYEAVDNIMCPRKSRISFTRRLDSEDFEIVEMEPVQEKNDVLEIEEVNFVEKETLVAYDFQNNYGAASILLLSGSLLVSIGVIFTIIFALL